MAIRRLTSAMMLMAALLTAMAACGGSPADEEVDDGASQAEEAGVSDDPGEGTDQEAPATPGSFAAAIITSGITASFESECARIDPVPNTTLSAVCALANVTSTIQITNEHELSSDCFVTISPSTPGCASDDEQLLLVLKPNNSIPNTAAPVLIQPDSSGAFVVRSSEVQPHTWYDVIVVRTCGGQASAGIVGFFGLCDPGGRANVIDSVGTSYPLGGLEVTVFQHFPNTTDAAEPDIDAANLRDCRIPATRGVAQGSSGAGAPAVPYWNDWSDPVNAAPVPPPSPQLKIPPTGLLGNPQQTQWTPTGGIYGWVLPVGCYQVRVESNLAGLLPPAVDSPIVGDSPVAPPPPVPGVATPTPAPIVDDLDITYFLAGNWPTPTQTPETK